MLEVFSEMVTGGGLQAEEQFPAVRSRPPDTFFVRLSAGNGILMSVTAFFPRRARRLWTGLLSCAVGLALCAGSADAQVYDGNAIMRQPMRENLCALTFDDGPSRYTPHILDVLLAGRERRC